MPDEDAVDDPPGVEPFEGYQDDDESAEFSRLRVEMAKVEVDRLRAQKELLETYGRQARDDRGARKSLRVAVGVGMVLQVVLADLVFIRYASHGEHWKVPTAAINAWLGATVVQLVGLFYVITSNLYPRRDNQSQLEGLTSPPAAELLRPDSSDSARSQRLRRSRRG